MTAHFKQVFFTFFFTVMFFIVPSTHPQAEKAEIEKKTVAGSGEKAETPAENDTTIKVKATRPGRGRKGTYTEVDLSDNSALQSAPEILENESGLNVTRYGPGGTFSSLSIRGADPAHTGIYLEGIPLNDAEGGAVNIENLPVHLFNRAELYRSYTPLHLPGNHMAGAVDFTLQRFNRRTEYVTDTGIHYFDGGGFGGSLGGGISSDGQAHYLRLAGSSNRYPYRDDNGTPFFNDDDDTEKIRKNEDFRQLSYTALLSGEYSQTRVFTLNRLFGKERGLPGVTGNETEKVRFSEYHYSGTVGSRTPLGDNLLLNSSIFIDTAYTGLNDPERELATGFQSERRLNTSFGIGINPVWYITDEIILKFSHFNRYRDIRRNDLQMARRFVTSAGSAADYRPADLPLNFYLSADVDYLTDTPGEALKQNSLSAGIVNDSGIEPAAMLRVGLQPAIMLQQHERNTESPELFISSSYSERFPSVREKYGDGSLLLPAASLEKETSLNLTAGLEGPLPCGIFTCKAYAAYFRTEMKNLILFIANSQRTMLAINNGDALLQGFESDFKISYRHYLQFDFKYTYLEAINKSRLSFYRDKTLPYRPRHQLNTTLETGSRRIRWFTGGIWQGASYRDRYNSYYYYLESRLRVFSGLHWFFGERLNHRLSFIVKNIFNERQVDVIGYPLPGRLYEISYHAGWM